MAPQLQRLLFAPGDLLGALRVLPEIAEHTSEMAKHTAEMARMTKSLPAIEEQMAPATPAA